MADGRNTWSLWYKEAVEGGEEFTTKWHQEEDTKTSARHAKEAAYVTKMTKREGRADDSNKAVGKSKDDMANRVARFQAG